MLIGRQFALMLETRVPFYYRVDSNGVIRERYCVDTNHTEVR